MNHRIVDSLDQVAAHDWNRLAGEGSPFTRYEFLSALEAHGCLGEKFGWWPQHLLVFYGGKLAGAAPMYLKDNSYGEFVFDWAWADAYQRSGLRYYPKLVVAVPYTPATGPRLLMDPEADREAVSEQLATAAVVHARALEVSGLHWLFTTESATRTLEGHGLMRRVGCQFHWHNPGYRDFDDFIDGLTSKKRKQIRRERRQAMESGVEIEVLNGHQVTDRQWETFHGFYRSTFDRKWGMATLTPEFFMAVGRDMPDAVILVLARDSGRYVAGAVSFAGTDALFGRHWGSIRTIPGVHFELCYYQAIEYCIHHGLQRFEAGAQGEHKIPRGFLPAPTYSAHWIRHPGFRDAIGRFLAEEQDAMQDHMAELAAHTPFRSTAISG